MPTAKHRQQVAAIPVREVDGRLMVCLVTSRGTGRWVIPKGNVSKRISPRDMAAQEAYEEAGLRGSVSHAPVGMFTYRKGEAPDVLVKVPTFLLHVERELKKWPEKGQRERQWMSPAEAAIKVSEAGLVEMLLRLAAPRIEPEPRGCCAFSL